MRARWQVTTNDGQSAMGIKVAAMPLLVQASAVNARRMWQLGFSKRSREAWRGTTTTLLN